VAVEVAEAAVTEAAVTEAAVEERTSVGVAAVEERASVLAAVAVDRISAADPLYRGYRAPLADVAIFRARLRAAEAIAHW
jgi:hypothetical protein